MLTLMRTTMCLILAFCALPLAAQDGDWIKLLVQPEPGASRVQQVLGTPCGTIFTRTFTVGAGGKHVYSSNDNGMTWTENLDLRASDLGGMIALRDGRLLIGGKDRVLQSEDCGATWTTLYEIDRGINFIEETEFHGFEQEPGGTIMAHTYTRVAAASVNGYSISNDQGKSWSFTSPVNINHDYPNSLRMQSRNRVLYASDDDSGGVFLLEMMRTDGSTILKPDAHGEGKWIVDDIAVNSKGEILVATDAPGARFFGTDDLGANWILSSAAPTQPPAAVKYAIRSDRHDNFFVGAGREVWYTDDLGQSWSQVGEGLGTGEGVRYLTLDSAGYLYAATLTELFRSRRPVYMTTDVNDSGVDTDATLVNPLELGLVFNPATRELVIDFKLEARGLVTAELFDIQGRRVKKVFQREFAAGDHRATNKMDLQGSGVYVLRLSAGDNYSAAPVTILR